MFREDYHQNSSPKQNKYEAGEDDVINLDSSQWKEESVVEQGDPNDSSTWKLEPRPDLDDESGNKVNEFETEQQQKYSTQEEIESLRSKIKEIDKSVQAGSMGTGEADVKVVDLEKQIYNFEGITKPIKTPDQENTKQEPVRDETNESVQTPEEIEKAEYLRLKREFKESERAYYTALEKDYADRNVLKKMFGIGRGSMSEEVKSAYDAFMTANKAYYNYGKTSGIYQKITDRVNRTYEADGYAEKFISSALAARRHVLSPAETRLDIQSTFLPEKMRDLKNDLIGKIKMSPNVAQTLGYMTYGYTAYRIFNAPAALAGMAVNFAANTFADLKESVGEVGASVKMGFETVDLEVLEAEYFNDIRIAQGLRTAGKIGAVGATMGMGGTFGSMDDITAKIDSMEDKIPTVDYVNALAEKLPTGEEIGDGLAKLYEQSNAFNDTVVQPEISSAIEGVKNLVAENIPERLGIDVPSTAEMNDTVNDLANDHAVGSVAESSSTPKESVVTEAAPFSTESMMVESTPALNEVISRIELIHSVESGDTTSGILLNALKEKVESGEIILPKGVDVDHLSHYMYQNFPEMTSASEVEAKLTPQEWMEVGVRSGDPSKIFSGDNIDVGALLEKLRMHPTEDMPADLSAVTPDSIATSAVENNLNATVPPITESIPDNLPTESSSDLPNNDVVAYDDHALSQATPDSASAPETTVQIESNPLSIGADGVHLDIHYPLDNRELPINAALSQMNRSIDFDNLKLPEGVTKANLPEFISKTFPEMVGLQTGQVPTLAPEYWKYLGISSGNPLETQLGDTFNVQKFYRLALSWPQTEDDPVIQELLIKEIFKEEIKNKLAGL